MQQLQFSAYLWNEDLERLTQQHGCVWHPVALVRTLFFPRVTSTVLTATQYFCYFWDTLESQHPHGVFLHASVEAFAFCDAQDP